jgi:ribonucleotide reductase beta subunit family protein with ferritin-like domain
MYKNIINQLKNQFPYLQESECRDKYNEFIQDLLHEEIISKL